MFPFYWLNQFKVRSICSLSGGRGGGKGEGGWDFDTDPLGSKDNEPIE